MLKNLALPVTLAFIIGLVWLLNQSIVTTQSEVQGQVTVSPWDGLQPREYAQAAALLKTVDRKSVV